MKKIVTVLLSFAVIVFITGCNNKQVEDNTKEVGKTNPNNEIYEIVQGYKDENSNLKEQIDVLRSKIETDEELLNNINKSNKKELSKLKKEYNSLKKKYNSLKKEVNTNNGNVKDNVSDKLEENSKTFEEKDLEGIWMPLNSTDSYEIREIIIYKDNVSIKMDSIEAPYDQLSTSTYKMDDNYLMWDGNTFTDCTTSCKLEGDLLYLDGYIYKRVDKDYKSPKIYTYYQNTLGTWKLLDKENKLNIFNEKNIPIIENVSVDRKSKSSIWISWDGLNTIHYTYDSKYSFIILSNDTMKLTSYNKNEKWIDLSSYDLIYKK